MREIPTRHENTDYRCEAPQIIKPFLANAPFASIHDGDSQTTVNS
jgi:hypothetical protein